QLVKLDPVPEVILLDDAFQHRKVAAGLNILLTSYDNLYSDDLVLPAGNLREPRAGAVRAHLVVVTKCPAGLEPAEKASVRKRLKLRAGQQAFFSKIAYGSEIYNGLISRELTGLKAAKFTLVSGIANPKPLVSYLRSLGLQFEHLSFSDHHNFSDA